jgi:hypothetical protein
MKKISIALLGAMFSLTAFSQDLLECVNPDVVNSLLFNGRADARYLVSPDLPDALSGYRAPAGFEFVGSLARNDTISTATFRTELAGEFAFDSAVAAFEAERWEAEEQLRIGVPVFSLTNRPLSVTLCRDGERRNVRVRNVNAARFVEINFVTEDRPRACHADDPRFSQMPTMGAIHEQLPTLTFPDSTREPNGNDPGGGTGGAGERVRTSVQVESPDTARALINHFAGQMADQGWLPDAGWSGQHSAGSTWSRVGDDNIRYTGILEAVGLGDSIYDVRLRLRMLR